MALRVPTYDLDGYKAEFTAPEKLRMERKAIQSAEALGITLEDVVLIIQSMRRAHFYKTMEAEKRPGVWQDVYHVPWKRLLLYVKLTRNRDGRLIISLKEK